MDAPEAAHPQIELLSQAVLFEDEEKHARMTAFLERRRCRLRAWLHSGYNGKVPRACAI